MSTTGSFFISVFAFAVLSVAIVFLWFHLDVDGQQFETLFLFSLFIIATLITVQLFHFLLTEKKARIRAMEMLERNEFFTQDLYHRIFQMSPVPYLLIERNGAIQSMNAAAHRLFMVRPADMTEKNFFDCMTMVNTELQASIQQRFEGGLTINNEDVYVTRSDGTDRWVLLSLFPYSENFVTKMGLLTLVDVTKEKQIDKAKTEFVSLASHQLRSPIAALKWNFELMFTRYGESLTPELRDMLTRSERKLHRMELLVEDFLSSSRFELGTLIPEYSEVELASFVDSILEEHLTRAKKKGVQVYVHPPAVDARVTTDEKLLRMITGNLVSNAIKYTDKDGVVDLNITLEATELRIEVADSGIGIPEEEQERIFSKIFRATNAKKKTPEGTGLGLYVVAEAVKVLGGTIDYVSKENKGTKFTATLPQRR